MIHHHLSSFSNCGATTSLIVGTNGHKTKRRKIGIAVASRVTTRHKFTQRRQYFFVGPNILYEIICFQLNGYSFN